jgi:hypothetical protein
MPLAVIGCPQMLDLDDSASATLTHTPITPSARSPVSGIDAAVGFVVEA